MPREERVVYRGGKVYYPDNDGINRPTSVELKKLGRNNVVVTRHFLGFDVDVTFVTKAKRERQRGHGSLPTKQRKDELVSVLRGIKENIACKGDPDGSKAKDHKRDLGRLIAAIRRGGRCREFGRLVDPIGIAEAVVGFHEKWR